jgi:aldose sugar dehydrogenase
MAANSPNARRSLLFRLAFGTAVLIVALVVLSAAFYSGIVAEQKHFPDRVSHYLDRKELSVRAGVMNEDTQTLTWTSIISNLHTLEYIEARIGPPMGGGGAIGEVEGQLILISPLGRLSYLNKHYKLGPIDLTAPMGVDELRKSKYNTDAMFSWHHFRAYDVMALKKADGSYDLYSSFSRYVSEQCFQFAVYRTPIEVTEDGIKATTGKWEEFFTARPGCLRPKDRGWRFLGLGAGGRLVKLDDHTMLISVGDHQYDGFDDSWAAAQDPSTDLGKIVAVDLDTKKARVFATGVRNPQGLVMMRDGRIFETEHGPQGGDEINLIREGANYGWPLATYGVNYGYPRRDWPFAKSQADHEGYDKPVFAFSPAIGPSNLVEADTAEFPLWTSDAILGSLRGSTIFHVRIEGERVRYVEPLFSREGTRFRDVTSLNGGFATLTNDGTVMIFRNAEMHAKEPRSVAVSGFGTLSAAYAEEVPPEHLTPADRGKELFAVNCSHCHSPTSDLGGPGPPLGGIVGRPVGAAKGFGYSPALANYKGAWTEDLLISFLTEPNTHFKGTLMPPPTMDWLEYPNIVAYLGTLDSKTETVEKK